MNTYNHVCRAKISKHAKACTSKHANACGSKHPKACGSKYANGHRPITVL